MAKSRSGEMAVYLLFDNSGLGHTLFKIDLPPMHSIKNSKSSSSSSKPISVNPVLELSSSEYPYMMSCAQLGPKLYLFGGLIHKPPPSPPQGKSKDELKMELLNHVLPRDVHIFDTTSTSMELGAEMTSGKVNPIVFVSKGMIYVLSAGRTVSIELRWWFYHHKTKEWLDTGDLMGAVKLFERYDPVANKWQVLDDSPLHSLSYLKGYLLLEDENQHKVVITSGNVSHLVYDLDKDLWLSSSSLIPTSKAKDMLKLDDNGSCQYVGGFCYGVLPHHQVFRLGPFNLNKDVESKLSNVKMSLVDSQDVLLLAPAMMGTSKLQHLGGGYFILLSASPANDNLGIPQPITRKVMINILKEVLPTAGASTQVDTASSFNAKIVFSQNYVCKMDFLCDGNFLSCFLVQSPVPTEHEA
ncbi:hypothetical protein OROHE_009735 [Orobanche hederae]